MQTQTYTVVGDGFLFGDHYKDGQTIMLNDKQARRFVDEGRLTLGRKPAPKASASKATEKPKADVKD